MGHRVVLRPQVPGPQASILNIGIVQAGVFEAELFEKPARPALIHRRHPTLVESDAWPWDLLPSFALLSLREITCGIIAPDGAFGSPQTVYCEPCVTIPG